MIMPTENITNADIAATLKWVEAMKWSALDAFNATLKFADHCVKRDLVPTTAVKAVNKGYDKTMKTNINDVLAAVNLIKHFGSAKAYDAEVDKYNNDDANKRVCYSHQTFQRKWLSSGKPSPKKPSGKAPSLDAAVKAGVLTKQQAAALRKMGF